MGSMWIAGSYQSDFARNYAREGLEISDMVAEAVSGTLDRAGVAAKDVEAIQRNARSNPLAQTRGWSFGPGSFADDDHDNPTYVLHWTNAYEEGDEIVVDGFFQGCPEPDSKTDAGPNGPKEKTFRFLAADIMQTRLHRWRMNLVTGATSERDLSDSCTEFGTINSGFGGRPYRYTYAATNEPGWFLFNGLVKHDTLTGREERYQFEPGVFCSEVGVAPRVGGSREDDAYLVTLTVDENRDLSECVVFRANDVGRGPIARAQLPERIASGTRSCWAPGESIAGW